jgi:hypothetical protein
MESELCASSVQIATAAANLIDWATRWLVFIGESRINVRCSV